MNENDYEKIRSYNAQITIHPNEGMSISDNSSSPLQLILVEHNIDILKLSFDVPFVYDTHGMIERKCYQCQKYFRSEYNGKINLLHCPYCLTSGNFVQFKTKTQIDFTDHFFQKIHIALESGSVQNFSFDSLMDNIKHEDESLERQTLITCTNMKCNNKYDIEGKFGLCPNCKRSNVTNIIKQSLSIINKEFVRVPEDFPDRQTRYEKYSDLLRKLISIYDGTSRNLSDFFMKLHLTNKRKNKLRDLTFHSIIKSCEEMEKEMSLDLFRGISEDDKDLARYLSEVRHLCEHRNGIIDQEFIDKTKKDKLIVGHLIRVEKGQITNLTRIISTIFENYQAGLDQILNVSK